MELLFSKVTFDGPGGTSALKAPTVLAINDLVFGIMEINQSAEPGCYEMTVQTPLKKAEGFSITVESGSSNSTTTIPSGVTTSTTSVKPSTTTIPSGVSTTTTATGARFTDNGDGTVTDTKTGVIWLKNANPCGLKDWAGAGTYCSTLKSGMAGLTDGSSAGQWRLPSIQELEGIGTDPPTTYCLVESSCWYPPVNWTMQGEPFTDVQPTSYWSGTTFPDGTAYAWYVNVNDGYVSNHNKSTYKMFVWPVRGGNTTTTTTSIVSAGYKLEYVSGNNQTYSGGGMPLPMVFRIKGTATNTYVTTQSLGDIGLALTATATKGYQDAEFNNLNNYNSLGYQAYGGYYYVEANLGSAYTLNIAVNLSLNGDIIDTYYINQFIVTATDTRFTDTTYGTVYDTQTGLIWLKNANPVGVKDWASAKAYCSSLKNGMVGLTDGSVAGQWRLPSKDELEGIGTDPPAIWESGYPSVTWTMPGDPFTSVQSISYWSGTSFANDNDYAWDVYMSNGYVGNPSKSSSSTIFVWPVRDAKSVPTERFTDNGNGTVTDTKTGLIWLKNANPCGLKDWAGAGTYCSSLKSGMAGLTDGSVAGQWRLPSLPEMEWLGTNPITAYCLDGTCDNPPVTWTVPGAPFVLPSGGYYYWSTTSDPINPGSYLLLRMDNGYVGSTPSSYPNHIIWPVRGGN